MAKKTYVPPMEKSVADIREQLQHAHDGLIDYVEMIQAILCIATDEHMRIATEAADTLKVLGYNVPDALK